MTSLSSVSQTVPISHAQLQDHATIFSQRWMEASIRTETNTPNPDSNQVFRGSSIPNGRGPKASMTSRVNHAHGHVHGPINLHRELQGLERIPGLIDHGFVAGEHGYLHTSATDDGQSHHLSCLPPLFIYTGLGPFLFLRCPTTSVLIHLVGSPRSARTQGDSTQ